LVTGAAPAMQAGLDSRAAHAPPPSTAPRHRPRRPRGAACAAALLAASAWLYCAAAGGDDACAAAEEASALWPPPAPALALAASPASAAASSAAAGAPLPRAAFVTFGTAPFAAALRRIEREARATGAFAAVHAFTDADIAPEYARAHADVLRQPRGGGLWLWKPYFVARVLAGLAEGELLLYADAGCELRASPAPYLELARRHGFLGFRLEAEHTLQRWTKGDVFAAVGLELGLFGIEPQVIATVFAMRKSARTTALVAHWLRLCEDLQLIGEGESHAPVSCWQELVGARRERGAGTGARARRTRGRAQARGMRARGVSAHATASP
jgi:hypothetical protein